jgi:hypothetical protein
MIPVLSLFTKARPTTWKVIIERRMRKIIGFGRTLYGCKTIAEKSGEE